MHTCTQRLDQIMEINRFMLSTCLSFEMIWFNMTSSLLSPLTFFFPNPLYPFPCFNQITIVKTNKQYLRYLLFLCFLQNIFLLFSAATIIYLFVCSLWLLGCIIFWGCSWATDAMLPLPLSWYSSCLRRMTSRVNPPGVNSTAWQGL